MHPSQAVHIQSPNEIDDFRMWYCLQWRGPSQTLQTVYDDKRRGTRRRRRRLGSRAPGKQQRQGACWKQSFKGPSGPQTLTTHFWRALLKSEDSGGYGDFQRECEDCIGEASIQEADFCFSDSTDHNERGHLRRY